MEGLFEYIKAPGFIYISFAYSKTHETSMSRRRNLISLYLAIKRATIDL